MAVSSPKPVSFPCLPRWPFANDKCTDMAFKKIRHLGICFQMELVSLPFKADLCWHALLNFYLFFIELLSLPSLITATQTTEITFQVLEEKKRFISFVIFLASTWKCRIWLCPSNMQLNSVVIMMAIFHFHSKNSHRLNRLNCLNILLFLMSHTMHMFIKIYSLNVSAWKKNDFSQGCVSSLRQSRMNGENKNFFKVKKFKFLKYTLQLSVMH